MNVKTLFAAVIVAGAAAVGASQASAMPVAPEHGYASNQTEQVRFGCPRGSHPNRYGRCVGNHPHYWRYRRY